MARGALAALAPAALLLVDPWGWYAFGPIKWLAITVLLLAGAARRLRDHPVRVPRSLAIALAMLVGWMAVAAAVGLDPIYAWAGTPERHLGTLTWGLLALALLVGSTFTVGEDGPALAGGLVLAALGVGTVATLEALGWEPEVFAVGDRLTATLGSSAYLGAATALLLPIAVGVAADASLSRRLRAPAAIAVPLLFVAAAGSGARAAWFGVLIAVIVLLVVRRREVEAHRRGVGVAALVAGAVAVVLIALTPVGDRLSSATDPDAPGGRGRLDEWRVATRVIEDHLVTGVGPEGYRIAFGGAVDEAYERAHGREQQPDRAHSAPLDVALAGGLPGLLAWLAVVLIAGRSVLAAMRGGPLWTVGVATGLVAHQAGLLLLFPTAELDPIVWLLAGVLVAHASPTPANRRVTVAVPVDVRPPVGEGWGVPAAVTGVLGALAVVAVIAGGLDVRADRHAADAVAALERGDQRAAAAAALGAVDSRPDIVRLRVLAATAVVAAEQGTLAGIEQLDAALDVSPGDPIVLLARARLLVARAEATGVPAHAEAAHTEVYRLLDRDPNRAALWLLASELATVEGDAEVAREAAARAEELTPAEDRPR